MAAIAESTAIVSAKARMALPAEMTRSAVTTSVSVRGKAGLCRFGALKVQQQPKRHLNLVAFDSKKDSTVVSEAQETTPDVPSVTDLTWQSLVLKADGPVLVMFSAPWCGPCRVINPVIGEIAKQYDGKLSCFKLNTDSSPSVATKHGVRSIPTIMIFNKGEKKESVIGAVSKSSLENTIAKFL